MPNFSLGLSALQSSRFALEVVSNNIANANTEGFTRQRVHLESLPSNDLVGFRTGSGVTINHIERVRNRITESSLTDAVADVGHAEQLVVLERQIEAAFSNGASPLGAELDGFFSEISKLTASPDEPAQRSAVIESGQRLAGSLRQTSEQLTDLRNAVEFQLTQEIESLNANMVRLHELNVQILTLTAQGKEANVELDTRDAVLNDIARVVGITRNDYNSGEINLRVGSVAIQQTGFPNQFSLRTPTPDSLALHLDDSDRPVQFDSGTLAALLEIYNSTIPKYEDKLDSIASNLMREVDSVHAIGVGSQGSFQSLVASRVVADAQAPLSETNTVFPIRAGTLTVSIVGDDGSRRLETIAIDPDVDSLDDIAARLSLIDGISANVNQGTNQLQLLSAEGFTFDFTGSIETQPALDLFTGTSQPSFSGDFVGTENQNPSFEIEGSGEVGITEDLFLRIYDDDGNLINRVSIGNGYEAGSEIELDNGLKVSFSRGTVNAGDTFETRLTNQPDETGILAALGVNSFFSGISAATIDVDAAVSQDHGRFASGKSDDAADTRNLFRFTSLEKFSGLPGDLTFSEYVNEVTIEIGFQVNTSESLAESLRSLELRLEQDRGAYSGVDLNEEMIYLQQFQKSYEAAARVIQVTDEILEELLSIFR